MRAGSFVATRVPPSAARAVAQAAARGISRWPAGRSGRAWSYRRMIVARHLRRVLGPDPTPAEIDALVDRAFESYARYWAESLVLHRLTPAELTAGVGYENYHHMGDALAAGRGGILAVPHLGGWEWAGSELAGTGHGVSVVVERLQPADVFDWFVSWRESLGMRVIPTGPDAAARCGRALADNHLLCLLADRLIEGTAGVEVEFFGEKTVLPVGPAMLALRSGAPLLPAAVYFGARTGTHVGAVMAPLDTTRSGRFREDVARVTQDLARAFEHLIRRDPTQWHLMQPNWPSDPRL